MALSVCWREMQEGGATGAQAGGLARAILDDPSGEFALRAVTRDPGKDAARALVKAVSVVAVSSRADVADFMLRQLDDRMYLHKEPPVMN